MNTENNAGLPTLEVVFSPLLYKDKLTSGEYIVVVADILRATTSMCAALDYGVASIIPVAGIEEAKAYKKKGYQVACERNGKVLEFADTGNSPTDFFKSWLKGNTVVFSTTNGTRTIQLARDGVQVLIGSFLNLSALSAWLLTSGRNVVVLCAAWKNLFNLEDSVFAGALAEKVLESGRYRTECDSVKAAIDLWTQAKTDLPAYLAKSSHRNRLRHLVTEDDYRLTLTPDTTKVIPVLEGEMLVPLAP
jgi:2-phosphosulfolactate phosphatase